MRQSVQACLVLVSIVGLACSSLGQGDIDSVSSEKRAADEAEQQSYFLINAALQDPAPVAGYGVIFILPGGSGSAEFNPFVQRIARFAAPGGFLVVQLVAPKWREDQAIVWPTQRQPVEGQEFTTEAFIGAVLDDVRATHALDEDRLLLMGWSSSGPVVYTMLCQDETPFDGFYISMSVFKRDLMPPIERARGRRVFIEHSPEDRICPFRLAQQAHDDLAAAGAIVHFESYAGGHGWRGAIYPRIKAAFTFLLGADQTEETEPGGEPAQ